MGIKVLKNAGLHTSDNSLSAVPEGAMSQADNCVIRSKDVLESRRGQSHLGYDTGAIVKAAFTFDGTLLVNTASNTLQYDTGSAFTTYSGTYTPPDASLLRMKGVEAQQNFYFTTSTGVKLLEAAAGTPANAGVPKALDGSISVGLFGSTNAWMPANSKVAYRWVWGIKGVNGQIKLGAPSGRIVLTNPAAVTAPAAAMSRSGTNTVTVTISGGHGFQSSQGVANFNYVTVTPGEANFPTGTYPVTRVSNTVFTYTDASTATATNGVEQTITTGLQRTILQAPVPDGITTSHFYRLYRSNTTASVDIDPGDELFLVYEAFATTTDIVTNDRVQVIDNSSETFLRDPLPTNANTGDGTLQSNERPPMCKDLTLWQDRLWFANTTSRHRFSLTLIGVGSPDGIQDGDEITIAGQTYTFLASGSYTGANGEVLLHDSEGVGINVRKTSQLLAFAINRNTANTLVDAFYVSPDDDVNPGQLLIEERAIGGSAFTVFSDRTTAWGEALTATSSGALTSENDDLPNGLFYSKFQEPEAVPYLNYLQIGAKNKQILRVIPLRDKLFVFKEDGIFTVSGSGQWSVDLLDDTTSLFAPDTVVTLSNQIFALTNQGVVAVSDTGVAIISRPIENDITELFGAALAKVKELSFGVSYESERSYLLFLPSASTDTYATQAYVYNVITRTWTRWPISRTCGLVNKSTDVLYMGHATLAKVWKERKEFTRDDYADETIAVTVSSSSGTTVTLASVTGLKAGDLLTQASGTAVIESIDTTANTVVVGSTESWTAGAATAYASIPCEAKWQLQTGGNPGDAKQFPAVTYHFRNSIFQEADATFSTDMVPSETTSSVEYPGYGAAAWGAFPWGNPDYQRNARVHVPQQHQRANYVTIGFDCNEAKAKWALNGITVEGDGTSERNTR